MRRGERMGANEIKQTVKAKYGEAALRVLAGARSSCCGAASATGGCDPITANLYDSIQTGGLPSEAVLASLTVPPILPGTGARAKFWTTLAPGPTTSGRLSLA